MVRNSGKRTLFPQNWSDNDAKTYRLQDFYDVFLFACVRDKMTKTSTADLNECASKIHFRTRRVRYTSRRQVLDQGRPKCNHSNSVYNVPRKISICLPKRSSNIYWGIGPVQM